MARRRRDRDEDDEDDDLGADNDAPPARSKPRADAYVGMLGITFLGLVASAVLLYLDVDHLGPPPAAPPAVAVPALTGATPAGA